MSGKPLNLPRPDASSPWDVFYKTPRGRCWALPLLAAPLVCLVILASILPAAAKPYAAFATILVCSALFAAVAWHLGLRPARPCWRPALIGLGIGMAAVAAITTLQMRLLHMAPAEFLQRQGVWELIEKLTGGARWGLVPLLILAAPFVEEVLFRGILQHMAVHMVGRIAGIALVALLFAAMHTPFKVAFPPMLAAGILFGILADRYGVATSFATHALYNACALATAVYTIQHASP